MKITPVIALSALLTLAGTSIAQETKMMFSPAAGGASAPITLAEGDTAELKFCSFEPDFIGGPGGVTFTVNANGTSYSFAAYVRNTSVVNSTDTWRLNPMKLAGPATFTFNTIPQRGSEFATVEIKRAGTASAPVPIPQEANTNWQVILEASSDLVNWTPVAPGTFPSTTPQRYFRTRLVKQ